MRHARWLLLAAFCVGPRAFARSSEALDAERSAATAELRDLDRRAGSLDDQLRLRQRVLRRRIRALYKISQGGAFRLIADARSLDDLDERLIASERVVIRDLEELGALDEEVAELGRDRTRRGEALALSAGLERPRDSGPSEPATGLLRERGALTRPVPGAINVGLGRVRVREPRAGAPAVELPRRAVELSAFAGETVHAIATGTVRWVGELDGAGRAVIIDHGDRYVSVTGRLERIQVRSGARVREGDTLGTAAGSTIAFELTEAKTPLDPARWLRPPVTPKPAIVPVVAPMPSDAAPGQAATLGR